MRAVGQSPVRRAARWVTVAEAGMAEAGGRQVVQTMPPEAGLKARWGPGSPQRAQSSKDGA